MSWTLSSRCRTAGVVALLFASRAAAQTQMKGVGNTLRLNSSDMAVLEAQEVRKDLACTIEPTTPSLGFDLRFHGGYQVTVPLKEIAGEGDLLTIVFRVTPVDRKDKERKQDPLYFTHHVPVPKIEEEAKGQAIFNGIFDLGEGKYHVDLLMRDRAERVCSFYWDSDAALEERDKQIDLTIPPGAVQQSEFEQFKEEPPVKRAEGSPLNIKILVNFAPQNPDASTLRPSDTLALVTMLRRLSREPQFAKFSVIAFNVQEERVLYRQSSANKIDFPALGKAIREVQPGKVDLKRLLEKHGEVEFLTDLIKKEMSASDHPDALIFAGPKVMLEGSVPEDDLRPYTSDVDFPVFYMNYNLSPDAVPWRDSIGKAIRSFHGVEFSINRPRDLWYAVTDVVSRIVKSKQGRNAASVSSQ